MENPEAFLDVLTIRALKERYHGNDDADCGNMAPTDAIFVASNHEELALLVRDFTIDDSISDCFAESELETPTVIGVNCRPSRKISLTTLSLPFHVTSSDTPLDDCSIGHTFCDVTDENVQPTTKRHGFVRHLFRREGRSTEKHGRGGKKDRQNKKNKKMKKTKELFDATSCDFLHTVDEKPSVDTRLAEVEVVGKEKMVHQATTSPLPGTNRFTGGGGGGGGGCGGSTGNTSGGGGGGGGGDGHVGGTCDDGGRAGSGTDGGVTGGTGGNSGTDGGGTGVPGGGGGGGTDDGDDGSCGGRSDSRLCEALEQMGCQLEKLQLGAQRKRTKGHDPLPSGRHPVCEPWSSAQSIVSPSGPSAATRRTTMLGDQQDIVMSDAAADTAAATATSTIAESTRSLGIHFNHFGLTTVTIATTSSTAATTTTTTAVSKKARTTLIPAVAPTTTKTTTTAATSYLLSQHHNIELPAATARCTVESKGKQITSRPSSVSVQNKPPLTPWYEEEEGKEEEEEVGIPSVTPSVVPSVRTSATSFSWKKPSIDFRESRSRYPLGLCGLISSSAGLDVATTSASDTKTSPSPSSEPQSGQQNNNLDRGDNWAESGEGRRGDGGRGVFPEDTPTWREAGGGADTWRCSGSSKVDSHVSDSWGRPSADGIMSSNNAFLRDEGIPHAILPNHSHSHSQSHSHTRTALPWERHYVHLLQAMAEANLELLIHDLGIMPPNLAASLRDDDANSLLHACVIGNFLPALRTLLVLQPGLLDSVNGQGLTPAGLAVKMGHTECLRLLLSDRAWLSRSVTSVKEDVTSLARLAVECGQADCLPTLACHLDLPQVRLDPDQNSLLHLAACAGNAGTIMTLLSLGCDSNLPNKLGYLPIHLALSPDISPGWKDDDDDTIRDRYENLIHNNMNYNTHNVCNNNNNNSSNHKNEFSANNNNNNNSKSNHEGISFSCNNSNNNNNNNSEHVKSGSWFKSAVDESGSVNSQSTGTDRIGRLAPDQSASALFSMNSDPLSPGNCGDLNGKYTPDSGDDVYINNVCNNGIRSSSISSSSSNNNSRSKVCEEACLSSMVQVLMLEMLNRQLVKAVLDVCVVKDGLRSGFTNLLEAFNLLKVKAATLQRAKVRIHEQETSTDSIPQTADEIREWRNSVLDLEECTGLISQFVSSIEDMDKVQQHDFCASPIISHTIDTDMNISQLSRELLARACRMVATTQSENYELELGNLISQLLRIPTTMQEGTVHAGRSQFPELSRLRDGVQMTAESTEGKRMSSSSPEKSDDGEIRHERPHTNNKSLSNGLISEWSSGNVNHSIAAKDCSNPFGYLREDEILDLSHDCDSLKGVESAPSHALCINPDQKYPPSREHSRLPPASEVGRRSDWASCPTSKSSLCTVPVSKFSPSDDAAIHEKKDLLSYDHWRDSKEGSEEILTNFGSSNSEVWPESDGTSEAQTVVYVETKILANFGPEIGVSSTEGMHPTHRGHLSTLPLTSKANISQEDDFSLLGLDSCIKSKRLNKGYEPHEYSDTKQYAIKCPDLIGDHSTEGKETKSTKNIVIGDSIDTAIISTPSTTGRPTNCEPLRIEPQNSQVNHTDKAEKPRHHPPFPSPPHLCRKPVFQELDQKRERRRCERRMRERGQRSRSQGHVRRRASSEDRKMMSTSEDEQYAESVVDSIPDDRCDNNNNNGIIVQSQRSRRHRSSSAKLSRCRRSHGTDREKRRDCGKGDNMAGKNHNNPEVGEVDIDDDYDGEPYDDDDDYDDDEDIHGGVRLHVENEDLPDVALRAHRLQRHLQSMQRLRQRNDDVVEMVITGTGERLTCQDCPSRSRPHVNIGEAYPFHDDRTAPDVTARHTSLGRGTAGKQTSKSKKSFGARLFNHEQIEEENKIRKLTESEFEEAYDRRHDVTVQRRRQMDMDVPWDQLHFSDSEDTDVSETRHGTRHSDVRSVSLPLRVAHRVDSHTP